MAWHQTGYKPFPEPFITQPSDLFWILYSVWIQWLSIELGKNLLLSWRKDWLEICVLKLHSALSKCHKD